MTHEEIVQEALDIADAASVGHVMFMTSAIKTEEEWRKLPLLFLMKEWEKQVLLRSIKYLEARGMVEQRETEKGDQIRIIGRKQ